MLWPPLNGYALDYIDDPLPKVGFGEVIGLAGSTWAFFYNSVIVPLADPSTYTGAVSSSSVISAPSYRIQDATTNQSLRTLPNPWELMDSTSDAAISRFEASVAAWDPSVGIPKPVHPRYTSLALWGPDLISMSSSFFSTAVSIGDVVTQGGVTSIITSSTDNPGAADFSSVGDVIRAWVSLIFHRYVRTDSITFLDAHAI